MSEKDWLFKDPKELETLETRQLLLMFRVSEGWRSFCSCGRNYHCGDDTLDAFEIAFNSRLDRFQANLKAILATREHVPRPSEIRRQRMERIRMHRPPEKKQMRYSR